MSGRSGRSAAGRVWLASADDRDAVTRLMAEFRDWQGRDSPSDGELARSVARLLGDPGAEYVLAARPDDSAAGVCQLRYRYGLWHSAEDCWLEDLFVSSGARGGGFGRALVEAAIERSRRRGCRRIELDADSDNDAALALYGRFGFSAVTPSGATRLMMRLRLE